MYGTPYVQVHNSTSIIQGIIEHSYTESFTIQYVCEGSLKVTIFEKNLMKFSIMFMTYWLKITFLMSLLWNWSQEVVSLAEPKYCEYRDAIYIFKS